MPRGTDQKSILFSPRISKKNVFNNIFSICHKMQCQTNRNKMTLTMLVIVVDTENDEELDDKDDDDDDDGGEGVIMRSAQAQG